MKLWRAGPGDEEALTKLRKLLADRGVDYSEAACVRYAIHVALERLHRERKVHEESLAEKPRHVEEP
jgi:hypothetical protein